MKKIAIIAAHPDDEAFGCSGTIFKHKNAGDLIHCLWLTDGIGARAGVTNRELVERHTGHQKAIELLKPDSCSCAEFADNQLDSMPFLQLVKTVENFLADVKPDIIYTHYRHDLNVDHTLVSKAVVTACRPGSNFFCREIYAFEVVSSTEWNLGANSFQPDYFVEISAYLDQKKNYLQCYSDELRSFPHARSMENIIALSQLRGAQADVKYAEAFQTLRRVD